MLAFVYCDINRHNGLDRRVIFTSYEAKRDMEIRGWKTVSERTK